MIIKRIRDAALVVGGLFTAVGVVPAEIVQVVAGAIEPIGGGVMAAIGVFSAVRSYRRGRKESEAE